ncbi:hypothetical protein Y1Q_0014727 [Alligator mississippiensis]|uniref:Uncharacterized protein n=1 Tax=Alligator mississippiensis TaxID=8496 RepID=A0A151P866_ALLMI|nr:hypothetical protein Y1Q_0014727 [Alligator mississippiensis]
MESPMGIAGGGRDCRSSEALGEGPSGDRGDAAVKGRRRWLNGAAGSVPQFPPRETPGIDGLAVGGCKKRRVE